MQFHLSLGGGRAEAPKRMTNQAPARRERLSSRQAKQHGQACQRRGRHVKQGCMTGGAAVPGRVDCGAGEMLGGENDEGVGAGW